MNTNDLKRTMERSEPWKIVAYVRRKIDCIKLFSEGVSTRNLSFSSFGSSVEKGVHSFQCLAPLLLQYL